MARAVLASLPGAKLSEAPAALLQSFSTRLPNRPVRDGGAPVAPMEATMREGSLEAECYLLGLTTIGRLSQLWKEWSHMTEGIRSYPALLPDIGDLGA